jgi:alcohol dehydrogenase class IV
VAAEAPAGLPGEFVYDALPGRVVFGAGSAREQLVAELDRLGAQRILLIAAEAELGLAQELAAPLRQRIAGVFSAVRPHVPVAVAEQARALARECQADTLLCIGGGSTTGTAKAVALELALPILAVPTTYAGSEMTPVWGLTEAGRKTTGRSPDVLPRVVIYDPQLTLTLPAAVSGPSAMNAIAHCVEALYVPGANPVTTLLAQEGIRALAAGVPDAVEHPGDLQARSLTLYGAYLAGSVFAAVGGGLHHRICHILGGALDLPHAETHTIVLPHVVAFFEPAAPDAMARIAAALGGEREDPGREQRTPAQRLYDLARRVDAPAGLREIGMREADLPAMIEQVHSATAAAAQPRALDQQAVASILTGAFEGTRPGARQTAEAA